MITKSKKLDSFRLSNGHVITTWGDFRKHVFPHCNKESRDALQDVMARYQRQGKCAADLCEDMQRVSAGRLS